MNGRFRFYRRRRALPFMAVACLVFINGATLAPLAVPPELAARAVVSPADAAAGARGWHHYERDDDGGQEPVVVEAVPPIVKNLRRPPPARQFRSATSGHAGRPADSSRPALDVPQQPLAANAADLTRLCRLLL